MSAAASKELSDGIWKAGRATSTIGRAAAEVMTQEDGYTPKKDKVPSAPEVKSVSTEKADLPDDIGNGSESNKTEDQLSFSVYARLMQSPSDHKIVEPSHSVLVSGCSETKISLAPPFWISTCSSSACLHDEHKKAVERATIANVHFERKSDILF